MDASGVALAQSIGSWHSTGSGARALSIGSAAQRDETLGLLAYDAEGAAAVAAGLAAEQSAAALRQLASERLAAHRRTKSTGQRAEPAPTAAQPVRSRDAATRVRDAVAARYRNSVTYREFLAQQAGLAIEQAQAEAEVAARKAQAVAEVQMQLLEEIEQWSAPEASAHPGPSEARGDFARAMADIAVAATEILHQQPMLVVSPATAAEPAKLTVRLFQELPTDRSPLAEAVRAGHAPTFDEQDAAALDEEIAFRFAPEFDAPSEPIAISANVIEFPRQLVAARKVRPRIAEGPLREESGPEPQLRIFEVEPEQLSGAAAEPTGAPEWQSLLLSAAPHSEPAAPVESQLQLGLQPQTARMGLRLMALAVDAACLGAAFAGFAAVAMKLGGPALHTLALPQIASTAAGVLFAFFVVFQTLFFTLSEATPGMRYARIALCTFGDANPTRSAMRRRILATLIAACPLGLGLAWAWMDEDRLGWHDRISRMYQRAY
jgi:hypothetical protein